jgi:5'-nucleotidase
MNLAPTLCRTRNRVTVNNYLAGGASDFSILTESADRTGGPIDVDALVAYFASNGPASQWSQSYWDALRA